MNLEEQLNIIAEGVITDEVMTKFHKQFYENEIDLKLNNKSMKFIEKYKNLINWDVNSYKLTNEIIDAFPDYVNWKTITKFHDIDDKFVIKYKDRLVKKYMDKITISDRLIRRLLDDPNTKIIRIKERSQGGWLIHERSKL